MTDPTRIEQPMAYKVWLSDVLQAAVRAALTALRAEVAPDAETVPLGPFDSGSQAEARHVLALIDERLAELT